MKTFTIAALLLAGTSLALPTTIGAGGNHSNGRYDDYSACPTGLLYSNSQCCQADIFSLQCSNRKLHPENEPENQL